MEKLLVEFVQGRVCPSWRQKVDNWMVECLVAATVRMFSVSFPNEQLCEQECLWCVGYVNNCNLIPKSCGEISVLYGQAFVFSVFFYDNSLLSKCWNVGINQHSISGLWMNWNSRFQQANNINI